MPYSVSIVIPTYLRGESLKRLLNSIKDQSVKPKEVLVVDDSPDDSVKDVVKNFAGFLNVSYIWSGKRSLPAARNVGVKKSTGDIILFLDDDVVLEKDFIEKMLKGVEKYEDAVGYTGVDLTIKCQKYGLLQRIYKKFFFLWMTVDVSRYNGDIIRVNMVPCNVDKDVYLQYLPGACMAFKREIFFKHNYWFPEQLKGYAYGEDLLFTHSLYLSGYKLVMLHEARYYHLREENPERENPSPIQLRALYYVYRKLWGWRGVFRWYRRRLAYYLKNL